MAGKQRIIEGLPVIDAKTNLLVDVNTKDVLSSKRESAEACAVSLAVCRQCKGIQEARIYLTTTFLKARDHWVRYITPDSIRTELICFDRTGIFAPDTYELLAPKGLKKAGVLAKTYAGVKHKKRRRIKPRHVVVGVRPRAPRGLSQSWPTEPV